MLIDALNLVGLPTPPPQPEPEAQAPTAAPPPGRWNLSPATKKPKRTPMPPSDFERWMKAAPSPQVAPAAAFAEGSVHGREEPLSGSQRQQLQQPHDAWAIHLVNAEYERSKEGSWRRLFPSARSSEYEAFFDELRRSRHFLPFEL